MMIRSKKLWFMILTLSCIAAIGTCIIVDYAINGEVTWSLYPLLSVPFGYLVSIPLFLKKHGVLVSMLLLTAAAVPFLYLLEQIVPDGDWFYPVALPVALYSLPALWIGYALIRFLKIHLLYRLSILVLLCGSILAPLISETVDGYTGEPTGFLNYFVNIFSCVIAAIVLAICGYVQTAKQKQ